MARRFFITPHARADLRSIEQPTALRILHALARFGSIGEGDVKSLRDAWPPELRLRLGDYRAVFQDDGATITVLRVGHRREIYR